MGRPWVIGSVLLALTIAGCGQDSQSAGTPADEAEVKAALKGLFDAQGEGDGARWCGLLTEDAQNAALEATGKDCVQAFEPFGYSTPPAIPEVGVGGNEAIALIEFDTANRYAFTLKKTDGEWLIDFLGVFPEPDALEGDSDAEGEIVDQYQPRVDKALAVGDLAIAYQDESDTTSTKLMLVKTNRGWQISDVQLGDQ